MRYSSKAFLRQKQRKNSVELMQVSERRIRKDETNNHVSLVCLLTHYFIKRRAIHEFALRIYSLQRSTPQLNAVQVLITRIAKL